MIVHYDPVTLTVLHSVTDWGPEYEAHLIERVDELHYFRLADPVEHGDIRIVASAVGPRPHRILRDGAGEEIGSEEVALAIWPLPPAPPRTLDGVRAAAIERIARRRVERLAGAPEASAYYQRKEGWARAHLDGEKAHPVIGTEAVAKGIACHELCARIVARADAARAQRAALVEQSSDAFDRAERVIRACQSMEEIDDYMAHFG